MANHKAEAVEAHDELLFSLAEALARQLPKRRRARFVRDWLKITASAEGRATPLRDGALEAARKAAATKVRERTPGLLSRLIG